MRKFVAMLLAVLALLGSAHAEKYIEREINGFVYSTPETWDEQIGTDSTVYISEHGAGSRIFVTTAFINNNVSYAEHEQMFEILLLGAFEDGGITTDFSSISVNNWIGLSCCGYLDARLNAAAFLTNETDTLLFFLGDEKGKTESDELQSMLFDFISAKVEEKNRRDTVNLSEMSLEELVELRSQIQLAMWETAEWQEVEVPHGLYEIGVDIPAGHWTITAPRYNVPQVYYGDTLNETGTEIISKGSRYYYYEMLAGKDGFSDERLASSYPETIDLELIDGCYFLVDGGSVIFTPYIGKPALGFK